MVEAAPVLKDEYTQVPIPFAWRQMFIEIVDAFRAGDFVLAKGITGVRPISAEDGMRIAANVRSCGARLASLPEETWQTSVCQWMRSYWDVLIDLFTVEEGASDLALVARVHEVGSGYVIEVQSVHVP